MSESITTGGAGKRLRIEKPGSAPQLVLWKHLLPLLRSLMRRVGIDLQVDGAENARVNEDGSIAFKIKPYIPTPLPFSISDTGKVYPGLVGTVMPTLSGERLDTTSNVLDLTASGGNFYVYFKLTYTVVYSDEYLSYRILTSVEVITDTGEPSNSDTSTTALKYLQFNTVVSGVPYSSYYTSVPAYLADNGANATQLMGV